MRLLTKNEKIAVTVALIVILFFLIIGSFVIGTFEASGDEYLIEDSSIIG